MPWPGSPSGAAEERIDRGEERLLSCTRGRHATATDDASIEAKETPTVVAPGTSVEGDVRGEGDLVVQGSLRGRASMGGTVRIEAGSSVQADIRAPRVVIVDGASFQGVVDTSGA
jgi:cytoskeletal protein CcmA (bactofilin family)